MADEKSAAKQLEAVLSSLKKSLLEASDEDIVKELRGNGVDPLKAMQMMNFADERAVEEHYQRLREGIARERAAAVQRMSDLRGVLPESRSEQLALLRTVCSNSQTLTAQFREMTSLDNLSDAELASMLQQFALLGYLSGRGDG